MNNERKVAFITGGSRGIGKAIVLEFVRKGAIAVFTYLNSEKEAMEIEEYVTSIGGEAIPLRVDTGDYDNVKTVINKVIDRFGKIDILVNNAGIIKDKTLLSMSPDEWNSVIKTNLTGIYNVTKICIFYMLKNKGGRIINLSSISGIQGLPGQSNYSASKAGIIGFTRAVAKEVAAYGITANVVAPGGVKTAMLDGLTDKSRENLLCGVPCKRFCEVEEVANVVAYLGFDSPTYLTGSVIVLDGGSGIG